MNRWSLIALLCATLGCQHRGSPAEVSPGHERGACRADHSCEPGLWCLSELCVRPPPADCKAVAELLASFQLGNYAEPEERAPIVARHADACRATYLTKEEGACIENSHDAWTARTCAPRMFPAAPGAAACTKAVARARAVVMQQSPQLADPSSRKWFDRSMQVMEQSCVEDGWPAELVQCMSDAAATPEAMTACESKMPPALQQSLQQRMAKAMNEVGSP